MILGPHDSQLNDFSFASSRHSFRSVRRTMDGLNRSLLLGGVLLLIRLLLGLQQAELVKSLVSSGPAQRLVGGELGFVLGDFARRFGRFNLNHRNDRLGRDLSSDVHFLLGSVSLVWLTQLLREEDEFGFVLLETLDVLLKRLDALVATTVIDSDTDRPGEILVKTGGLDLLQSEASAKTLLLVVFDSRAPDDGSERGGGSWRDTCGLGLPHLRPSDFWPVGQTTSSRGSANPS